ncbi:MAG: hypothetical protein LKKZDAJK_002951, partial [Candidatus Fervidibacter sp.]
MPIGFKAPIWLLLLPLIWLSLWWTGRFLLGMSPARKRFVLALRGLIATLLVLALAGAQFVRMPSHICTIFVVDASESVDANACDAATKFIADALRHKAHDDLAGIIVFGRQPIVEIAPSNLRRLPAFHAAPDRTATDIASALRLAMGLFPEGFARRIVLLSDGNETNGDSIALAQV